MLLLWTDESPQSPPTMDDIAKEIYRFRKKFNIQPNATSRNLLPSQLKPPFASSPGNLDRNGNLGLSSSHHRHSHSEYLDGNGNNITRNRKISPSSTIPFGFPKLEVQYPSPLSSSTPIKPSANANQPIYSNNNNSSKFNSNDGYPTSPVGSPYMRVSTSTPLFPNNNNRPMSALSNSSYNSSILSDNSFVRDVSSRNSCRNYYYYSQQPPHLGPPPTPPIRNFSSSGRKIFPSNNNLGAFKSSVYNSSSGDSLLYSNRNGWGDGDGVVGVGLAQKYRRNSMSLAEPSPGALTIGARTSLSDFKKLLQAAKPKKNSISAMEALKPKIIGVETTLQIS
jgi:hypothetical protein